MFKRLFVVIMIIVALIILPSKFEALITLWIERKNTTSYSTHFLNIKHIVVCLTHLNADFVLHFLREFYSHRKNEVNFFYYFFKSSN